MQGQALSVSELTERIKALLETHFASVYVRGEVSSLTRHSSGHLYFSLKDENSRIGCALWRSSASGLKFALEEGMSVIVRGELSLYTPRGEYKLICKEVTPDGIGALSAAYEQLKKRLAQKGYFDDSRKKPIPKLVKHIAIVTSSTGAALQDMLKVANKRWNLLKITLVDSAVQGEGSKYEIARGIKIADSLGADIIVVGRGGGSLEDLWAFNEEVVAEAIFEAKTPIVSAVGHEVDFLISDFVADLRAPTPSAAMEAILPDKNEIMFFIDDLTSRLDSGLERLFALKRERLDWLKNELPRYSLEAKLKRLDEEREEIKLRLSTFLERIITLKSRELESIANHLVELEPSSKVKKGFAEVTRDGVIIELGSLKERERIRLNDGKYIVDADIVKINKIK